MASNDKKLKALKKKQDELEAAIEQRGAEEGNTVAAVKHMNGIVLESLQNLQDTAKRLQRKVKRMDKGSGGGSRNSKRRSNNNDDGFFDSDLVRALRAMSLDAMYSQIEQFDRIYEMGPRPKSLGYTGPSPYIPGVAGNGLVDSQVATWFYDKAIQSAAINRQRTAALRFEALVALFNNGMTNKRESGGSFMDSFLIMSMFNPAGAGGGNLLSSLTGGGISIIIPAEDAWRKF
jgi:hypothetical protein